MKTTLSKIVRQLRQDKTPASVKAEYALEALVRSAMEPGKDVERKRLAVELADLLSAAHDEAVLCLLLEELQKLSVHGTERKIGEILASCTPKAPQFTYALNALRPLDSGDARKILRRLCVNARLRETQAILALALLQMPPCPDEIIRIALDIAKRQNRYAPHLRAALASAGVPEAYPVLKKALCAKGKTAHALAIRAMADYFDNVPANLAELPRQAMEFLHEAPSVPAVGAVVKVLGETSAARDILFAAIRSGDAILRNAALEHFVTGFPGAKQTEELIRFTASLTNNEARNDAILLLQRRNDPAACTAIRAFQKSSRQLDQKL